ncbi:MAG: hydrogenase nickel incorporation protein HypB [Betaproteobacteria bacterium]|nr:hydrogenase nickel incorporation protein HypB [Betaproteobacteria bacterium]
MCTVCGCGAPEGPVYTSARPAEGEKAPASGQTRAFRPAGAHEHLHRHADGTVHDHAHDHVPGDDPPHRADGDTLDYGTGPARAHAPGLTQSQMVKIEQDILGKNDRHAGANRRWLAQQGILALNLVSSPGSGKTTLLVRTIERLAGRVPVAVIEGDQQTDFDAERIRATGAPALQINTGKGCHLDAHMVGQALGRLQPQPESLLLIENVGNLVCPAAFDLGEAHKVVILSVTEGEDKPLKYPDMFAAADLMLLNKADLLPHLDFDVERAVDYARRINPKLRVIRTSATSGEGFDDWLAWIDAERVRARAGREVENRSVAAGLPATAEAEIAGKPAPAVPTTSAAERGEPC